MTELLLVFSAWWIGEPVYRFEVFFHYEWCFHCWIPALCCTVNNCDQSLSSDERFSTYLQWKYIFLLVYWGLAGHTNSSKRMSPAALPLTSSLSIFLTLKLYLKLICWHKGTICPSFCRPVLIISVFLIIMTNSSELPAAAYTIKAFQQVAGENSSMRSSSKCLLFISKYTSDNTEKRRGSGSREVGIC